MDQTGQARPRPDAALPLGLWPAWRGPTLHPGVPACEFVKKSDLVPAQADIQLQGWPLESANTEIFTASAAEAAYLTYLESDPDRVRRFAGGIGSRRPSMGPSPVLRHDQTELV